MTAFIVLLVAIFISRIVEEWANKKLEADKKIALIDLFSKQRIWSYGILILIVGGYFACLSFKILKPSVGFMIYTFLLSIYILSIAYFSFRKLKANDFPGFYISSYLASTLVRLFGLALFFVLLEY